jgi:hypothetical protein
VNSTRKKGCVFFVLIISILAAVFVVDRYNEISSSRSPGEAEIASAISETPSEAGPSPSDVPTSSPSEEPAATETPQPDSTFKPISPQLAGALYNADKAALEEINAIADERKSATEEIDLSLYSEDFRAANQLYKSGDFESARRGYLEILDSCPLHLGARNNYSLSLMQLDNYEEALSQCLVIARTNPQYLGNRVNMLIPLYALGYNRSAYMEAISGFTDFDELELDMGFNESSSPFANAYAYNRVYAGIEESMDEADASLEFDRFREILENIAANNPDDDDYWELIDYLEGLQKIRFGESSQ